MYRTPAGKSSSVVVAEHSVPVSLAVSKLKPAFDKLRQDRELSLTKQEFHDLCPDASTDIIDGLFSVFDIDCKDGICYAEMCPFVLLSSHTEEPGEPEEKLETLFPIVDIDGNNLISREELTQAMRMLHYACFRDMQFSDQKVPEIVEEAVSSIGSDEMSLRDYTNWVRSDLPLVTELRKLLKRQPIAELQVDDADLAQGKEKAGTPPLEHWTVQASFNFSKINVGFPVVELDGDEMTRVMWQMIKEKLIFPYVNMEVDYYDLSITYRDETDDQVVTDAAKAIQKYNVGVKCATITPNKDRVLEFNLRKLWPGPSSTIRNILDGTMFHEPIVCSNIPRSIPSWKKPVIIGRHAYADQYKATQLVADRPGSFKISFTPQDGKPDEVTAYTFTPTSKGGVMLGMYNTTQSIENFAKCCFEHALDVGLPLYLSTKSGVLKDYDGAFVEVFRSTFDRQYKAAFEEKGLWYQHRDLDEMVRLVIKSSGGFVWALKNYDGDLLSNIVAQGYGSPGLMMSTLTCPDGKTVLTEAAHGTVTSHYRALQRGEKTSTNPMASIFAWSRALSQRAKLDENERLAEFSHALEEACRITVEKGLMSKDLAQCLYGPDVEADKWLNTEELLNAFAKQLRVLLCKPPKPHVSAQAKPFEDKKE